MDPYTLARLFPCASVSANVVISAEVFASSPALPLNTLTCAPPACDPLRTLLPWPSSAVRTTYTLLRLLKRLALSATTSVFY